MQKIMMALSLSVSPFSSAQFSRPYEPANWTFSDGGGNGTVDVSGVPASIFLTGNNAGGLGINTDYTIPAVASGLWGFSWTLFPEDEGQFDAAYYLINGQQFLIGFNNSPSTGTVGNVPINAGDLIGFRVFSVDGVLGPLTLLVEDFSAPVPAPGGLALAALAGGVTLRRPRRRG